MVAQALQTLAYDDIALASASQRRKHDRTSDAFHGDLSEFIVIYLHGISTQEQIVFDAPQRFGAHQKVLILTGQPLQ